MKVILVFAMLLAIAASYSCPEMDIDLVDNNVAEVDNVESWQDCGEWDTLSTS